MNDRHHPQRTSSRLEEMDHHHHHHHRSFESARQACNNELNDTYYQYAAQNNLGVMRLRQKRYLDAANCFCQAVKYVNERSAFYGPRHVADPLQHDNPNNNNRQNSINSNLRQRQSSPLSSSPQSPSTDSSSTLSSSSPNHQGGYQRWSIPSSNVSETEFRYPPPHSMIESFYLLLDEEHGGRNANDSSSNRHNSNCTACNASESGQKHCCCVDDSSSSTQRASPSTTAPSQSQQQQQQSEGTYVFRNPILVSKRGGIFPNASSIGNTRENRPTAGSSIRNNTIDKATCAKLSLISVYNMALTYHLAALDNDSNNNNDTTSRSTTVENHGNRKRNHRWSKQTNEDAPGTSPCAASSTSHLKRQKISHCSNACSTIETTSAEGGNCDAPHDSFCRDDSKRTPVERQFNNDTTASASVDRVLLGQALAYYQIAYRILVSEQRVLVSQAMVILNNIGHIHRLMGREDLAKKCFQRLLTTMVYLQQTGDHQQISHWDSFLTNVLDLIISPEDSHKKFAPAA